MPEFFELRNIDKHFGDNHVVKNVSFGVRCGEIFSLLGPSGCGKTTILRISGGFEEPDSGEIFLDGKNITDAAPNKRKINTVFQNYALFPHMSVFDNIAFGPRTAGIKEKEVGKMVEEMLSIIRLEGLASRKTDTISGGQKQRIAIARALINKPKLLLLDEPLAALDLKLRQYMLLELDRIHDEVGTTFIYVTHDQGEAMSLSDRIAVMNGGVIEQIGTPAEIYESPRTKFVASFIGDTNFFEGTICDIHGDYCILKIDGFPPLEVFNDKKMKEDTDWAIQAMHIKTPSQKTQIRSLSGGNQQKVIIGRWLLTKPEILLLDEPTRGIDVGAKYEIYQLIIDLANEGKGVIVVSSEMPELLGICDRILVMSGGQVAGEVDAKNTSQEEILTLAAKYV